MLHIKQIIEDRYKSNSYVLFNTVNCIIIDINLNTIEFIKEKKLNPVYLFLTHEHFDHIKGTSQLKNMFPNLIIVASKIASDLLTSSQGNLSFFLDGKGFEEIHADIFTDDKNEFIFEENMIKTYPAPGHTTGGIFIHIDNMLFTGDTILDIKTPTTLPNSSKKQLKESIDFVDNNFSSDTVFYQGHGRPFLKLNWDKTISLPLRKK